MNFDEMDIEPKSEPPAGRRTSPDTFAKVNDEKSSVSCCLLDFLFIFSRFNLLLFRLAQVSKLLDFFKVIFVREIFLWNYTILLSLNLFFFFCYDV